MLVLVLNAGVGAGAGAGAGAETARYSRYSLVQPGSAWYSLVQPGTVCYSLVQSGTIKHYPLCLSTSLAGTSKPPHKNRGKVRFNFKPFWSS